MTDETKSDNANSWLYHGPRLAFQPVLIWWALYSSEVIHWPWRQ
jgi:uncharacterized membrane protein